MRIAVPAETDPAETRVAASPETVKKFIASGATVVVQSGAGQSAGVSDSDFQAAGASISMDALTACAEADLVLRVRRPSDFELAGLRPGALVVALMDPYGREAEIGAIARTGVSAFAMEFMPRISRAQSMDVLSSQANLAGYRAVVDAAAEYGRALPMMMTAAGTVPAARRKFSSWASASQACRRSPPRRRLGAIVTRRPTCVRPRRSKWSRSERNSSQSRTRSSGRPRRPAATPRKCRSEYQD